MLVHHVASLILCFKNAQSGAVRDATLGIINAMYGKEAMERFRMYTEIWDSKKRTYKFPDGLDINQVVI